MYGYAVQRYKAAKIFIDKGRINLFYCLFNPRRLLRPFETVTRDEIAKASNHLFAEDNLK